MNHLKAAANGDPKGSPWPSNVEDITEAKVLTEDDNGKEFLLNAAAGVPITLPVPKAGLCFGFTTKSAFATSNFAIGTNGGANVIQGQAIVNGANVVASNEDSINFVATAETIGDHVTVFSDGTSWFVRGAGASAGSITFTAA